jgi:cation diffusion facilitator family transporter
VRISDLNAHPTGGRTLGGVSRSLRTAERAALLALVITCVMAIAKLGAWLATGSLVLLSQAFDSLLDVVLLGVVFWGVRIASKPADTEHQYGHAKAENLVAYTQTLVLGAIVLAVAVEAVRRLAQPGSLVEAPLYALILLFLSAAVDVWRVRLLTRAAREEDSDALRAGALNFITDIGTATVAVVSLVLVRVGIEDADAVGALLVAAGVLSGAVRVGKRSVDILMDRAPDAPRALITEAAMGAPGVSETRRVRVRSSGHQLFADVTVATGRTASLERAHDIAEEVERAIEKVTPGADVVVHVEPSTQTSGLVERVQAAASRVDGVNEVHNVLVHAFSERGVTKLHATLHAKIRPGTSLAEAHDLSDRIESAVSDELGPHVRVDTHIEPLERTTVGRDVTEEYPELIRDIKKLAVEKPDVIDCHEVLVTSTGEALSVVAHVRGRKELPLELMHAASQRIENSIHAAHPEVGPVLIHFEPA